MANTNLIPPSANCKRPLSKWPRADVATEIARVDAVISILEAPGRERVDLTFLPWQPLGQVSRLVSLQSLRKYRQRLGRAS